MTNYYVELNLDRSSSIEELEQQLKTLKKKWTARASSAPTTEKRQQAERMVDMIREASEVLLVKDKKAKYDKQLDKDPAAASTPQPAPQPAAVDTNTIDDSAYLDLIEQFYDTGNYAQAIAVGQKAIETNNASVDVLHYIALCHAEQGHDDMAFKVLQFMLKQYGDDDLAHFWNATICLKVIEGHREDARKSIDWLIENGQAENSSVIALDVEYDIYNGDGNLADKKIDEYLAKNPSDKHFREQVSYTMADHANEEYFTQYGGDVYFNQSADLELWLMNYKRAIEINPDSTLTAAYEQNKEGTKLTFFKDNLSGIGCGLLFAVLFAMSNQEALFYIFFILTIALVVFSFVPKWEIHRAYYTGHLSGIHEIFRYVSMAFSILLRLFWGLIKFVLALIGIGLS